MISFKQYITEKSVKGIKIKRYLLNPTPMMLFQFMTNPFLDIRFLEYDGDMYFWDGYLMTHDQFEYTEILGAAGIAGDHEFEGDRGKIFILKDGIEADLDGFHEHHEFFKTLSDLFVGEYGEGWEVE